MGGGDTGGQLGQDPVLGDTVTVNSSGFSNTELIHLFVSHNVTVPSDLVCLAHIHLSVHSIWC